MEKKDTAKMPTLRVTIESCEDMAREILKGIFLFIYLKKLRLLVDIISKKLGAYHKPEKDKPNIKVFEEEGDEAYIQQRKKEIDDFLNSDDSELNKNGNSEINNAINDRFIQKVARSAHKLSSKIKNKTIKAALGGSSVMSFLCKVGIIVKTEVIN